MKVGSRADLKGIKRKEVEVTDVVPDVVFRLREMNGTERDAFESGIMKEVPSTDAKGEATTKRVIEPKLLRARLVALCLVDEEGKRLYADNEIQQLSDEIPSSALAKLFEAAQKLNGLDEDAVKAARGNSPAAVDAVSTST